LSLVNNVSTTLQRASNHEPIRMHDDFLTFLVISSLSNSFSRTSRINWSDDTESKSKISSACDNILTQI